MKRYCDKLTVKSEYHILFPMEYGGKYRAWIGYKEATAGNNAFKVERYYHTDWLAEDELSLKVEGLNLDAVYEVLFASWRVPC
ncbi:MAG: DUF4391 domain-containing protein [Blautia faecis]